MSKDTVPMGRLFINCWDYDQYAELEELEICASTCATVAMLALKGYMFLDATKDEITMIRQADDRAVINVITGQYTI